MEKINIVNLASVLAQKHNISNLDAKKFIDTFIEVIQEGINEDKLVKLKGLGTFKIIGVESRESVDVNTGNRVVIEGHDKLSFTPDTSMKELVNRPCSQFETVILNDGVTFEDDVLEEDTEVEPIKEVDNEATQDEEPNSDIRSEANPVSEAEQESQTVQEKESDIKPKSEPVLEIKAEEEPISEIVAEQEHKVDLPKEVNKESIMEEESPQNEDVYDEHKKKGNTWKFVFIIFFVALLSLGIGYFFGQYLGAIPSSQEQPSVELLIEPEDVQPADSMSEMNGTKAKSDTTSTISIVAAPKDTVPFYKKYEDMDARVRTGAYHIVGTDRVVKAKQGQTLGRISRSILGEGMECYMEVYNNMKASTVLEEGQEVLIPKLEWKKKKKN